jgi:hypothetical protein
MFNLFKSKETEGYAALSSDDTHTPYTIKEKEKEIKTNKANSLTWRIFYPNSLCPLSRRDNFYIDSPHHGGVFIGYGIHHKKKFLNDLWFYHKGTQKWRQIHLKGDVMKPRTGTRAAIIDNSIICFGGYSLGEYLSDLHVINVVTGVVSRLETTGPEPTPRTTPIVEQYNLKLFVWGGYSPQKHNELSVLDLATLEWKTHPQTIDSRTAIPHIVDGSKIISYGSSTSNNIIVIDMEACVMYTHVCTGQLPPSSTMKSSFVSAGKYAYFLGGNVTNRKDHLLKVYKYNINERNWSAFDTSYYMEGVPTPNGKIKKGTFLMKQHVSSTLFFDETRNELCLTLGYPEVDPPCIYILNLSEM